MPIISGNSEATTVFSSGDEFNVCGNLFVLKDCPKLNDKRLSLVAEMLHAQKMCPHCSSNYHSGFF